MFMDIIRRIAISNSNTPVKNAATAIIAQADQEKVESWNKNFEADLERRYLKEVLDDHKRTT